MEANFCVDCLEESLRLYGRPEVFNSDQGAQFTADAFTSVLKREGITISMDGRGRAFDNIFVERLWRTVKYEDVYLKGYANMGECTCRSASATDARPAAACGGRRSARPARRYR